MKKRCLAKTSKGKRCPYGATFLGYCAPHFAILKTKQTKRETKYRVNRDRFPYCLEEKTEAVSDY